MKKMHRLLAIMLALLLAMSTFAWAEDAESPDNTPAETDAPQEENAAVADDTVLFTVYDREVTKAEVSQLLNEMAAQGYVEDVNDYDTAIEYMVQQIVIDHQISEMGLDVFTPEEEQAFRADADAQWEEALDAYVSYFLTEDTDEARAKARLDAEAYYTAYGMNADVLYDQLLQSASYDRLQEKLFEGQDVSASEEEIRETFETYAEQDKQTFGNDISMYEIYQYNGYDLWYQPGGYRGILHILLNTDQELLDAYQTAQASFEEAQNSEESAATPVTAEDVEAAKAALLANHQKMIDDIYSKLAQGETFQSLIALYGTDPGMQVESNLESGYAVHQDSILWDPAFTAGAFSEKMQKPGDVSDPVIGTNGIHILYYLRDIPEGYVEMTDEIRASIEEYVAGSKKNAIISAALTEWIELANVQYNEDAINAARVLGAEAEE